MGMENTVENKTRGKPRLALWFAICPAAHTVALISALIIALHLALRGDHALMARISENVVRPVHAALAWLSSHAGFSVAEALIIVAAAAVLARLVYALVRLLRGKGSLLCAYRLVMELAALALAVYAGFSLLWGVYYYGDDFMAKSGLDGSPVSTEQLETVTEHFVRLANRYGDEVERNADGFYICDRDAILARSKGLFDNTVTDFPCMSGPRVAAKGVLLSRGLSYIDFTGFFFPFTGEANVNTDFPPCHFAATVAHELSHQRGVAKEQEANFAAVLASLRSGDADFCYSAAVLAYVHLGNALYSADRAAWERVYGMLNDAVKRDLALNSAYWRQFETPVQSVSNTVYEGFLHSYDQTLGLKSYGACVDLLVNYYYADAAEKSVSGGNGYE